MTDAVTSSVQPRRPIARFAGLALWLGVAVVVVLLWSDVGGRNLAPALIDVHESVVPSPGPTRVRAVHVRPGDVVNVGDVLVELDTAEADLETALAHAELERVRLNVKAKELGVADQDFELGVRLTVENEKASIALTSLRAEMRRNESELASLDQLITRHQNLVQQKLASASTLDDLEVRRASLAQRVAEASKEQAAAEQVEAATTQRLRVWRSRHGDDATLTAPDQAAVVAQEERVKQAVWAAEQLVLRAPMVGRVAQLSAGVGDIVREGEGVVSVLDTAPTRATAWVGEESAWRVKPGDAVTLRSVDGRGVTVTGTVRSLGGGILEAPTRLRQIPSEPMFGRAVYIDLVIDPAATIAPLPGQTFEANFVSAGG